mgnify:CR=1 FL=1
MYGMKRTILNNHDLVLFVECYPHALRRAGTTPSELIEFLRGNGFRVFVIDESKRTLELVDKDLLPRTTGNLYCTRELSFELKSIKMGR